jgi:hypothetical protein
VTQAPREMRILRMEGMPRTCGYTQQGDVHPMRPPCEGDEDLARMEGMPRTCGYTLLRAKSGTCVQQGDVQASPMRGR